MVTFAAKTRPSLKSIPTKPTVLPIVFLGDRFQQRLAAAAICALGIFPTWVLAESPPEGPRWPFRPQWLAVDTNECCDVGDIDRDGDVDVIAGRIWYANPEFLPRPVRALGEFADDYSENNGEHLLDVNLDGWLDVIAGSFVPTQVQWFENPRNQALKDGKLWKPHSLVDTGLSSNEMTWLRDMDGDGVPDFVVNSWDAANPSLFWKLKLGGSGVDPSAERREIGTVSGHGQGFGDVNGDGRDDVVFAQGWFERPAVPGGQWIRHADFDLAHASCPILVRDVDGDGRADLIWGNGHGYGLQWMRQLPATAEGKTSWDSVMIDDTWSQAHALTWADLDGDGREELVTGKRVRAHPQGDPGTSDPAAMFAYAWNASAGQFERHLLAPEAGTGLQIRAADLNHDGRIDLIAAGKEGTKILWNGNGP